MKRDGEGARKFAAQRTEIKRASPMDRRPVRVPNATTREPKPKPPGNEIPPESRRAVRERSGGRCEARIKCNGRAAAHMHHRKLRRARDHRPINLLHVCTLCHEEIHNWPTWSYDHGYLVRSTDDPEDVPLTP